MSTEVRPFGVKCNIQCQYCYQNPQRDAGNIPSRFDVAKMKAALDRIGSSFTIFGGEPLLVPEPVLEELWAFGLERFGTNGIQTNGTLINDRHIALFKRYSVNVGLDAGHRDHTDSGFNHQDHTDIVHSDHGDGVHIDDHGDGGPPHSDAHTDTHGDINDEHTDVRHFDQEHSDFHGDSGLLRAANHVDRHGDR